MITIIITMMIILIILKKNGHLALVLFVEYMGGDDHAHTNGCHYTNLEMTTVMLLTMVVVLVIITIMVLVSNQETKFVLVWVL